LGLYQDWLITALFVGLGKAEEGWGNKHWWYSMNNMAWGASPALITGLDHRRSGF